MTYLKNLFCLVCFAFALSSCGLASVPKFAKVSKQQPSRPPSAQGASNGIAADSTHRDLGQLVELSTWGWYMVRSEAVHRISYRIMKFTVRSNVDDKAFDFLTGLNPLDYSEVLIKLDLVGNILGYGLIGKSSTPNSMGKTSYYLADKDGTHFQQIQDPNPAYPIYSHRFFHENFAYADPQAQNLALDDALSYLRKGSLSTSAPENPRNLWLLKAMGLEKT
jgi:hypothetical protein